MQLSSSFKTFFEHCCKSLGDLIYPPLCLHCESLIPHNQHIFCPTCSELLTPIESADRCPYCFSSDYCPKRNLCGKCHNKKGYLYKYTAVFDYIGPAGTLVKKMKYAQQPYLSRGGGAYMAAQLLRLGWPLPDYIIPIPMPFSHWIDRGYNQSHLLAESMGKILSCPVKNALRRDSLEYSQAGLSFKQRLQLKRESITLKNSEQLTDKTVLLVDDVKTTGTTLKQCAATLMEAYPSSIYAITLCIT